MLSKKQLRPCELFGRTQPCKPYLRFHSTPYAVTCVIRVRSLITTVIPLAPRIRDDARLWERGKVVWVCKTSGCKKIAARSSLWCPSSHTSCARDWKNIQAKKTINEQVTGNHVVEEAALTVWTYVEDGTLQAVSSFPFNSIRSDMHHQGMEFHYYFDTASTEHQGRCTASGERLCHFVLVRQVAARISRLVPHSDVLSATRLAHVIGKTYRQRKL